MRYDTRCGRCREWMTTGTVALRVYGGLWHPACHAAYVKERDQRTMVASGAVRSTHGRR